MAETWEDCVALLRAGASPSDVLPKLRELIHSEPRASMSPMEVDSEASEALPILRYKLDGTVLQLPYLQPPLSLWQALSNYADDYCFDTEATVDVLDEFAPIFVGPPEEEVTQMLARISVADNPGTFSSQDDCEHERDTVLGTTISSVSRSKVEAALQELIHDPDASIDFVMPLYSEADWAHILCHLDLERVEAMSVSSLIRHINQPQFSRVALRSILPVLSHDMETEAFLDLVTMVAGSADVSSMTSRELATVMSFYRSIPSKGALAQLRILCCREAQ